MGRGSPLAGGVPWSWIRGSRRGSGQVCEFVHVGTVSLLSAVVCEGAVERLALGVKRAKKVEVCRSVVEDESG